MMRSLVGLLVLSVVVCACLVSPALAEKERIGIVEFQSNCQYGTGNDASDVLATEFFKNGNFHVVERDKIEAVMREQGYKYSGRFDTNTAPKIGKLLGLQYIISGAVTSCGVSKGGGGYGGFKMKTINYHATVDMRMIDANTGIVAFAETETSRNSVKAMKIEGVDISPAVGKEYVDKALRVAMERIVKKLDQKLHPDMVITDDGTQAFCDLADNLDLGKQTKLYVKNYYDKVKGSEFTMSGSVANVESGRGGVRVQIENDARNAYKGYNIELTTADEATAASLGKGQKIRFKGKLNKYKAIRDGGGIILYMTDGVILQ